MSGSAAADQSEPIGCDEVVELVTEYLEGALDAATRTRFEAHLALCEGCEVYLEQIRTTMAATGSVGADSLPPDAVTALLQAFRDVRRP